MLDCTHAAPLWTADADARVLSVVAKVASGPLAIDMQRFEARVIPGTAREHVRLIIDGEAFRLDVTGETVTGSPVQFTYLIARDYRLAKQIETIQRLEARLAGCVPSAAKGSSRIARLATALRAWDARMAGASLKAIATELLEPGDWPGPGECRKSAARRLVTTGQKLVADGPRPILAL